jgi:hypothetical protein
MKLKLTLIALLISATSAHAELVATDWKNTGDGLATLDTATGIEWLDLTQTGNMSINQVESLTGVGGTFEGWRLPTRAEVMQMMRNAFPTNSAQIQIGSIHFLDNAPTVTVQEVNNFRSLLGITVTNSNFEYTSGIHKNDSGQAYSVLFSGVRDRLTNNDITLYITRDAGNDYNISNAKYSVYLVSDGGTTLDSQLDPTINENNINYVAPELELTASSGSSVTLESDFIPSGTGDNEIRFAY